jgi:preprotein translocase subunit YajC
MGNEILASVLASTPAKSSGGSAFLLIGLVVLFGLLYFVTIRPQRNRQRAAMQTQQGIEPGMRVRTTAGMYATVVAVEDQDVILEIAPGVEIRCMRRAILDVVPEETEADYAETAEDYEGNEAEDAEAEGAEVDDAAETVSETEDGATAS